MSETTSEFHQWCILEQMGHIRTAGLVTEEEHFGCKLGRIDIPTSDGRIVTQFFSAGSVFRLTPTTEEIARAIAKRSVPDPVHRWELPAPESFPSQRAPVLFQSEEDGSMPDDESEADF